MKNNYTFHRIPDKRFKNSTIPKKNSKKKDNTKRSVSSNIEEIIRTNKQDKKKLKNRIDTFKGVVINNKNFHKLRTR